MIDAATGDVTRDDQGQPLRMSGICIDVTERQQAEEELARHREHLEDLVAERIAIEVYTAIRGI